MNCEDSRRISNKLDLTRSARGMSVAELARRIGTDRKRLWNVLNGKREMRVEEFLRACVALRIDPRSFISKDMAAQIQARKIDGMKRGSADPLPLHLGDQATILD